MALRLTQGKTQGKNSKTTNPGNRQDDRVQMLLALEAELRRQKTPLALSIWAVNELRSVIDYSQSFLFRLSKNGKARISAISNLAQIDRQTPFVRIMEARVANAIKVAGSETSETIELDLADRSKGVETRGEIYPFQHVLLVPLFDRHGKIFGGVVFARRSAWQEGEKTVAVRLGETIAHCFSALLPHKKLFVWQVPKKLISAIVIAACGLMFVPVPMTTLAPAEIVADKPVIVAAPIDGVVAKIFPDPNVYVKKGDVLFEFDNTELKAQADIALRKQLVAEAKLATTKQVAFNDSKVFRELAIAKAEVGLAKEEKRTSGRRLARSVVRARRSGLLIYTSRKDWIGKPLKTGERVMEIAEKTKVVIKIALPVAEAIALKEGADIRLFLDADPLKAWKGKMRHASFHATEHAGVGLAFEIVADLEKSDQKNDRALVPRIGLRGTAQIFGETVFLGFYLFRKPVSAFRQLFGV